MLAASELHSKKALLTIRPIAITAIFPQGPESGQSNEKGIFQLITTS